MTLRVKSLAAEAGTALGYNLSHRIPHSDTSTLQQTHNPATVWIVVRQRHTSDVVRIPGASVSDVYPTVCGSY